MNALLIFLAAVGSAFLLCALMAAVLFIGAMRADARADEASGVDAGLISDRRSVNSGAGEFGKGAV